MERAKFPEKAAFVFEPWRYKVLYGGRGSAKSWSFSGAAVIQGASRPFRVACARETMQSIRDSVHELLTKQIDRLGYTSFYQVQQAQILGPNGTRFSFHGLRDQSVHNIKSLEGAHVCWVSEAQNVSKRSWDTLIPTIRDEGSEIWIDFNPQLDTDDTYRRFVTLRHTLAGKDGYVSPDGTEIYTRDGKRIAKVVRMNWQDNPFFTETLRREMEACRARSEEDYLHIYEGQCIRAVEGAVYQKELAEAEARITRVPYDPLYPVDTFWDLGWGDNTSIWFTQSIGFEFRLIDFLQGSLESLQYYLKALQSKPYVYRHHHLPHDAQAHELGSGRSIEEQMRSVVGVDKVRIVKKLSVADGLAAARAVFPKCYFDAEKCSDGIQALRHYKYERDDKRDVFKREPDHDWASHAADAFRYFAVAIREQEKPKQESYRPQPRIGVWS